MEKKIWDDSIITILQVLGDIGVFLVAPFWVLVGLLAGKPKHYVLQRLDRWSFAHTLGAQITTMFLYWLFLKLHLAYSAIAAGYAALLIWVIFWEEMVDGLGIPFHSDPNGADKTDIGADLLGILLALIYIAILK